MNGKQKLKGAEQVCLQRFWKVIPESVRVTVLRLSERVKVLRVVSGQTERHMGLGSIIKIGTTKGRRIVDDSSNSGMSSRMMRLNAENGKS